MTILFRPQGAFGWFSYTTSRDTIKRWAVCNNYLPETAEIGVVC